VFCVYIRINNNGDKLKTLTKLNKDKKNRFLHNPNLRIFCLCKNNFTKSIKQIK